VPKPPVRPSEATASKLAAQDILDTAEAGPRVIRGSVWRLGGYLAGILVTTVSAAVLLRHLGVVDAGRYVTVVSLVAIVGGLSDLGLTAIGVREYTTRTGSSRDRFMRNLVGMRIAFTVTGIGVATGFAVAVGYVPAMVAGTVVAGGGFLLLLLQSSLSIPLQAQLRLGWVTTLQLGMQVGTAATIVALSVAGAGLVALLAAPIPAGIVAVVLTAVLVRSATTVIPAFQRAEWRSVMRDLVPYSIAVALSVLYFRLSAILVSLMSTAEQTGYYGAAFRVLEALTAIPPLLVSSAFPVLARAARDDRARLAYALGRVLESGLILGLWAAIAVALGAPFAIEVIAGGEFDASVDVLRLLGPALAGTFIVAGGGYGLLAIGAYRAILTANLVAVSTVVALSALLVPAHGAEGAAIALVAAELALAAAYGVALARSGTRARLPARLVWRAALAAAAALALPLALGLPAVPAVVAASVVYFAALAVLGGIPPEVVQAFRPPRASGEAGDDRSAV
jgi:O-antigen/teichoic acid export membrane protein